MMSLRIEFDYQIFSLQRHGGISRYFSEIATRMADRSGVEVEIHCPFFVNEYLARISKHVVRGRYVRDLPRTARLRHWLNGTLSGRGKGAARQGVHHWTYYGGAPRNGAANVVTVYDMAHERFPGEYPKSDAVTRNKREAVRRADAVICISHHTRKELLDLIPVDPGKVHVTHLGFTPLRVKDGFEPPASMGGEPFILYVGIRKGYKNFARLLRAYGSSGMLPKDFRLVCLGGGGFDEEERRTIRASGLEGRVLQFSADDHLLAYSYARAGVFVYPSYYEGFGIPPLEAMSSGCPVVCGRTTSLGEVVAEAARIVDPMDEHSLARGIEAVLYSREEADRLKRAGKERSEAFSWDRCAEETMAVYRGVCRLGD